MQKSQHPELFQRNSTCAELVEASKASKDVSITGRFDIFPISSGTLNVLIATP